ncbi:cysteine proteinase, partial [Backusella circina FSU 941]
IFTDMINRYGVKDVVVEYVCMLDDIAKLPIATTYAIILAFQYIEDRLPENLEENDKDAENIIFSTQLVLNSCATQSLVNTLANLEIEKGKLIQGFIDYTDKMDPVNRGLVLGNVREFREIHNSYEDISPPETTLEQEDAEPRETQMYETEDVYHFISYLPKNGFLWELDSLKKHPVKLMAIKEGKNWLERLQSILSERIE